MMNRAKAEIASVNQMLLIIAPRTRAHPQHSCCHKYSRTLSKPTSTLTQEPKQHPTASTASRSPFNIKDLHGPSQHPTHECTKTTIKRVNTIKVSIVSNLEPSVPKSSYQKVHKPDTLPTYIQTNQPTTYLVNLSQSTYLMQPPFLASHISPFFPPWSPDQNRIHL
jgi:hypothetical protein